LQFQTPQKVPEGKE